MARGRGGLGVQWFDREIARLEGEIASLRAVRQRFMKAPTEQGGGSTRKQEIEAILREKGPLSRRQLNLEAAKKGIPRGSLGSILYVEKDLFERYISHGNTVWKLRKTKGDEGKGQ